MAAANGSQIHHVDLTPQQLDRKREPCLADYPASNEKAPGQAFDITQRADSPQPAGRSSGANDEDEPLLADNPDRFCMFPIKYQAIWEFYKKAEASFWTGGCEVLAAATVTTINDELTMLGQRAKPCGGPAKGVVLLSGLVGPTTNTIAKALTFIILITTR